MPLTIEEIEANIAMMKASPYRQIEVFKDDAAALGIAVDRLREAGINTDIPCLVQSLIDGYLETIIEEEME